jgi:hypothetical protein
MGESPDARQMGRKGGLARTEAQTLARRRNILQALSKRHPNSMRIRQSLEAIRIAEARLNGGNGK